MDSSDRFNTSLIDSEIDSDSPTTIDDNDSLTEVVNGNGHTDADADDACETIALEDETLDINSNVDADVDSRTDVQSDGDADVQSDEGAAECSDIDVSLADADEEADEQIEPAPELETPPVSPFRAATLSVAEAIESVVSTSDERHESLQHAFDDMQAKQVGVDARQKQLIQSVASVQSWQSQSDGRLNQLDLKQRSIVDSQKAINQTVNTVLANQKTSAKSYADVMAALNSIQATQKLDQERLDEVTQQFESRVSDLRKTVVTCGAVVGFVAVVAVIVGIVGLL